MSRLPSFRQGKFGQPWLGLAPTMAEVLCKLRNSHFKWKPQCPTGDRK